MSFKNSRTAIVGWTVLALPVGAFAEQWVMLDEVMDSDAKARVYLDVASISLHQFAGDIPIIRAALQVDYQVDRYVYGPLDQRTFYRWRNEVWEFTCGFKVDAGRVSVTYMRGPVFEWEDSNILALHREEGGFPSFTTTEGSLLEKAGLFSCRKLGYEPAFYADKE